jgi:transmembrane 9 superfamily protein 2/4
LGVHVPLLSLGSFLGFRQATDNIHIFTNQIARSVPPQPLSLHPVLTGMLGGLLPFGTAAIELSSLYASAWNGRVYSVGLSKPPAPGTESLCSSP